jgi:hypothetical protein
MGWHGADTMIVNSVNLTEGKHYVIRVKGVGKFKEAKQIVYSNATIYGDNVDVYEYPGENEVRILLKSELASSTGFARMIAQLADLEGVL